MAVPGYMIIAAEDEDQDRMENLSSIFYNHRDQGARWALATFPGVNKRIKTRTDLLDPIFVTTVDRRLPDGPVSLEAPPVLQDIPEETAWLGDNDVLLVGSNDCFQGTRGDASWFLSRELAMDWQAFVTKNNDDIDPAYECAIKQDSFVCEVRDNTEDCFCGCSLGPTMLEAAETGTTEAAAPVVVDGDVYLDHKAEPGSGDWFSASTRFRIWIPGDSDQIRGVYFYLNPRGSPSISQTADSHLQNLCREHDFALLGAKLTDISMSSGIGDALLDTLALFAAQSDRPELAHSAIFMEG